MEYYSATERKELLKYATTNESQEDYTAHTHKKARNKVYIVDDSIYVKF